MLLCYAIMSEADPGLLHYLKQEMLCLLETTLAKLPTAGLETEGMPAASRLSESFLGELGHCWMSPKTQQHLWQSH